MVKASTKSITTANREMILIYKYQTLHTGGRRVQTIVRSIVTDFLWPFRLIDYRLNVAIKNGLTIFRLTP